MIRISEKAYNYFNNSSKMAQETFGNIVDRKLEELLEEINLLKKKLK